MVRGDLFEELGGDLKLVMDFIGNTDLRVMQK